MKNTDDILEILIGKYLDGEISPTEQCMLDKTLQRDSRARELFGQFQDLHRRTQEAINSEILGRGKDAEEIFERAYQQTKHPLRRIVLMRGRLRFAAGLAAGLVIGFALHFAVLRYSTPPNVQQEPTAVVQNSDNLMDENRQSLPSPQNVIRNVDWYTFTDENGNQWLIEGLRENMVRTASFQESI